jgi:hypothetical protein
MVEGGVFFFIAGLVESFRIRHTSGICGVLVIGFAHNPLKDNIISSVRSGVSTHRLHVTVDRWIQGRTENA